MSKFNSFIEKRNFKKIFIGYIIIAIILGVLCAAGVGCVYKDKIQLAMKYDSVSERLEDGDFNAETIQVELKSLSQSSADITDILLLDSQNNVVYSTNNTDIAEKSVFNLRYNAGGDNFLTSDKNSDVAFWFADKEEFILSAVFAGQFPNVHGEYDNDHFAMENHQGQKVYTVGVLEVNDAGDRVYIISDPVAVQYGLPFLGASAGAALLLFLAYWLIIAFWVYQNALKSHLHAPLWGIVTLFANLLGVLIYVIYKRLSQICEFCGAVQSKINSFCVHCGKKIGVSCSQCGHHLKAGDKYCPHCGNKIEQEN